MVCIASATTAQLFSKSASNLAWFNNNLPKPLSVDPKPIKVCPNGTPTFRKTVLSVKSRCNLDIGSFADKCSKIALAIPKLPSLFSKSIGFTLCGIALLPTSPALIFCLK